MSAMSVANCSGVPLRCGPRLGASASAKLVPPARSAEGDVVDALEVGVGVGVTRVVVAAGLRRGLDRTLFGCRVLRADFVGLLVAASRSTRPAWLECRGEALVSGRESDVLGVAVVGAAGERVPRAIPCAALDSEYFAVRSFCRACRNGNAGELGVPVSAANDSINLPRVTLRVPGICVSIAGVAVSGVDRLALSWAKTPWGTADRTVYRMPAERAFAGTIMPLPASMSTAVPVTLLARYRVCLLYTSDAADEEDSV